MQYGEPTQNASAFFVCPRDVRGDRSAMESENFDEDAWKGGAGPIGYLSATIGFLLSVAGCRRLPRRTDLSCAVCRFLLRGSVWLPHLSCRYRRVCLPGAPRCRVCSVRRFGSRQETLVDMSYRLGRPDDGRLSENRSDASGFRAGGPRATVGRRPAGCPCKGRCRLPRVMTLRANFRAGQRSRRIRLLVLSLCSTTGAEYPNGSYSAAIRPPRRMPCVRHR